MALVWNQFGIKQTSSTTFHVQGNGRAGQAVKQVKQTLQLHMESFGTEWDKSLHFCLMSLRSSVNTSTGVLPARLFLGREMRAAGDIVTGINSNFPCSDQPSYARRLLDDVSKAQRDARSHLEKAQSSNKKNFDLRAHSENLKKGSRVLCWNFQTLGSREKFTGPFIIEALDNKKKTLIRWEIDDEEVGWVSRDRS